MSKIIHSDSQQYDVLNQPGAELQVEIEAVTDNLLPRNIRGEIVLRDLPLKNKAEYALFISVR